MRTTFSLVVFWISVFGIHSAYSQTSEVSPTVIGFNTVVCPGGSDTAVGVPFHRAPVLVGKVNTTTDQSPTAEIDWEGASQLEVNGLNETPHYLRFTGGQLEGAWFEVASNSETTVEIEIDSDETQQIAAGDTFEVIPHWTLATLLPPESQEVLHSSTGTLPTGRGSSLLFTDVSTGGIELAPNRIFFVTDQEWFEAGEGFPSADDILIKPNQAFVIRHQAGADDTDFAPNSYVHSHDSHVQIRTRVDGPQDNILSLSRPIPVKLSDLDLDTSVFIESDSTDPGDREDELIVYENVTAALNKGDGTSYFRVAGNWHLDNGSDFPNSNDETIPISNAIILRKQSTQSGETILWKNTPRY